MAIRELISCLIQPAAVAARGILLGCVAYAIAFVVTITFAPRSPEGIREVVNLPWPVFAFLPSLLSFGFLPVACHDLATPRERFFVILLFSAAVGVCTYFGIDLLRRDYIGKF